MTLYVMSSKIIIIATVALLIISFSALFAIEAKNHDYDYNKSWSVVYFEKPDDNSLNFAIENHLGEKKEYSYSILVDEKKVAEGNVEIESGQTQEVVPLLELEKNYPTRVSAEVTAGDLKYRIYKDIK
jgi:hypothetical protein